MKTTYFKDRNGNQAESTTETNPTTGKLWQITTMKRYNGQIACIAQEATDEGGGSISFMMFGGDEKRVTLATSTGKATENEVKRVHEEGLKKFAELQAAKEQEPEPYKIEIGQVFFTDGPFDTDAKRAVYEIVRPGQFKTVLLDGSDTRTDSHVRKFAPRQGIGVYYNEGERVSIEEVNNLLNQAREAKAERARKAEEQRSQAAQERARKIEAGRAILDKIPAGVTHVIVAELHENTSDSQSDYFAHQTNDIVYLAWSHHGRDLFPEMRKAAERFEGTKHLGADPQHEHREKYSMGSGYYLKDGHSNASGWAVSKSNLPSLETLQIAAAEGKLFCNTSEPETAAEAIEAPAGSIQIIEHPKRAGKILVIGETYPIREKLKSLGGWWNKWEKGWEYKADALQTIVEALKPTATAPAPESIPEEPTPEEEEQITEQERERWERERIAAEYKEDERSAMQAQSAVFNSDEDAQHGAQRSSSI